MPVVISCPKIEIINQVSIIAEYIECLCFGEYVFHSFRMRLNNFKSVIDYFYTFYNSGDSQNFGATIWNSFYISVFNIRFGAQKICCNEICL